MAWWPGYYNYYRGVPYVDNVYVVYGDAGADADVPYAAAPSPYTTYKPTDELDTSGDVQAPGSSAPETSSTGGNDPYDFHGRALAAFEHGDYRSSIYLAAHATVDEPRSQRPHLLIMLGTFAIGEYRRAAIEAHIVASLGKVPDWPAVYGLYNDLDAYTKHLRALEKYVHDKPASPEGRFLLGFQYMMSSHRDEARDEFLKALKLAPKDRLAADLLKANGGTVPPEIAKQLPELPEPQKTFAPTLPQPPAPQSSPAK